MKARRTSEDIELGVKTIAGRTFCEEKSVSPTMTNVTATASGGANSNSGVYNNSSSPTIKNSSISGTTNSIYNGSSSTARVGATMLDGSAWGGGFTCVGAYNASFTALGSGCL